MLSSPFFDFVD